jgi:hypothetical protein
MMHLRYLRYIVRHKWFVLLAGLKTGAPLWRLIVHDWSKFTPREWFAYARNFYGKSPEGIAEAEYERELASTLALGGGIGYGHNQILLFEKSVRAQQIKERRLAAFNYAWLSHQHRNPHHWQHWILAEDTPSSPSGKPLVLPIPDHFVHEMVADWMGAGRAITGKWEVREWYAKNRDKIQLAPQTREHVEHILATVSM